MSWFDSRAEQAMIAADDGAALLADLTEDGDFDDHNVVAALVAFRIAKHHLDIARRRYESVVLR